MRTSNEGFTLYEVIASLVILLLFFTLALPLYRSYTKKSIVQQGVIVAKSLQGAIMEYYEDEGRWPQSNREINLAAQGPGPIKGVAKIAVIPHHYASTEGPIIEIIYQPELAGEENRLLLTPTEEGHWLCGAPRDNGVPERYRPDECDTLIGNL